MVKTLKQYPALVTLDVERGHTINLDCDIESNYKETSWKTIPHLYGFTLLTCTYYLIKSYQM